MSASSKEFERKLRRALASFCYVWGVLFGAIAVVLHAFLVVVVAAALMFIWDAYQAWRRF